MAKLEIDLAEFDRVRDTIKEKEATIVEKDGKIKDLEKTIVGLEKESRVVQITKTVSGYNQYASYIGAPTIDSIIDLVRAYLISASNRSSYGNGVPGPGWTRTDLHNRIEKLLSSSNYSSILTSTIPEVKEYINFDDVKAELRTSIEESIGQELSSLKIRVGQHKAELEAKDQKTKEMLEAQAVLKDKIIKELEQKIDDIVKDKIYKDELEELRDSYLKLEKKYEDLKKNTPWWRKLLRF